MSPSEQVIVNCWYRLRSYEKRGWVETESLEGIPKTNKKVADHLDIAPSRIEEVVNTFVVEA